MTHVNSTWISGKPQELGRMASKVKPGKQLKALLVLGEDFSKVYGTTFKRYLVQLVLGLETYLVLLGKQLNQCFQDGEAFSVISGTLYAIRLHR